MSIPYLLILLRLLLAPIVLLVSYLYGVSAATPVLFMMYIGLISDIFDGIIARKQNISTEKLRRIDSQVDLVFWISVAISAWFIHPDLIWEQRLLIAFIVIAEALCYIISFIKFGKETCTHAFFSKIWGLTLLLAFTAIFSFGITGIPFYVAFVMGLVSHLDVILIILILPKWQHDIPSSYHAYLIRQGKSFKKSTLLNR